MRGNELEKAAEAANRRYKVEKKALILKVPTPIVYTNKGMIAKQSTVDFVGIISGGTFIAFDAKETLSKTSFPLKNIHQHQLTYLDYVDELGGIAFFLIHFKKLYKNQAFEVPVPLVKRYWYEEERASIPITEFKKEWLVTTTDYLTNK